MEADEVDAVFSATGLPSPGIADLLAAEHGRVRFLRFSESPFETAH